MAYEINLNLPGFQKQPATVEKEDYFDTPTAKEQRRQLIILGGIALFLLTCIVIISKKK